MKNLFSLSLRLSIIFSMAFLGSCTSEEEPVPDPVVENAILSEDYVEGIYVVGFNIDASPMNIESTSPAVFSPHSSRKTFDIHPSGKGDYKLNEGAYWVNYHFAEEPNKVLTLPVLVTKNKTYAKESVSALKKMKDTPAGYTLILRHAHSDVGSDKIGSSSDWFKSCSSSVARQMSQTGINDSKKIGSAIKALNISVGATTSSQFCRAVKTLELMEFGLPIVQDARLNHQNANSKSPIFDDVDKIIQEKASPNGIHIIVGHYNMCNQAVYQPLVTPLIMGDGWIMKTETDGKISFVGAVPLFYWDIFS